MPPVKHLELTTQGNRLPLEANMHDLCKYHVALINQHDFTTLDAYFMYGS